jgi:hypothetical protein
VGRALVPEEEGLAEEVVLHKKRNVMVVFLLVFWDFIEASSEAAVVFALVAFWTSCFMVLIPQRKRALAVGT